jgi:hypothetical protein
MMMGVTVLRTEIYEVLVTGIEQPAFDYSTSTSPRSRSTWLPMSVKVAWKRIEGKWVLITCDMRCGQVLKDRTIGRNGKVFNFLWRGVESIPKPDFVTEIEDEHHPSKLD